MLPFIHSHHCLLRVGLNYPRSLAHEVWTRGPNTFKVSWKDVWLRGVCFIGMKIPAFKLVRINFMLFSRLRLSFFILLYEWVIFMVVFTFWDELWFKITKRRSRFAGSKRLIFWLVTYLFWFCGIVLVFFVRKPFVDSRVGWLIGQRLCCGMNIRG